MIEGFEPQSIWEWVEPVLPIGWAWARAQCVVCFETHCYRRIGGRVFCLPCADRYERDGLVPPPSYAEMFE